MKLRDKYFNKETGEIRTVVLLYSYKPVCGLSLDSSTQNVIIISKVYLNLFWEKYEADS